MGAPVVGDVLWTKRSGTMNVALAEDAGISVTLFDPCSLHRVVLTRDEAQSMARAIIEAVVGRDELGRLCRIETAAKDTVRWSSERYWLSKLAEALDA